MHRDLDSVGCPVCGTSGARAFFCQGNVPTQCGHLALTRQQALEAPVGDITLRHCRACGHVWNSSFDPDKVGFSPDYDLSQYYSPTYRDYVVQAIERLKSRYHLEGKVALDVACGKGDFMRMLITAGFARAIGFDPGFADSNLSETDRERITVYKKYYDASERALRPDLVTCRSALQYVQQPRELLRSIRETLEGQHETVVCFEVPNGAEAFQNRVIWYVMYEAACFFSAASLARIFRECGFEVLDVLPALGGSHLEIEARPSVAPPPSPWEAPDRIAEIQEHVAAFSAEYASQVKHWSTRFDQYCQQGKRVVLWAAGMRAISLLTNVPSASASVQFVVDVNKQRQGRYLPKTGQQVISPEELIQLKPDVVIATNPHYAREISAQMKGLALLCEFQILR
jgi:hypothetical protein